MAIGRVNTGGGGSGGTLTVTGIAGHTVTATKDGKTYTRTFNSNGVAVFKGLSTGTWTLTMTGDGQTATRTVDVSADYAVTITYFSATISVTYPAGSTCTCTDGTTILTDTNTDTSAKTVTFTVLNTGTWTITVTDGDKRKDIAVEITTDGQSESVTLSYEFVLFDSGTTDSSVGGWDTTTASDTSYSTIKVGTAIQIVYSDNIGNGAAIFSKNKVSMAGYSKLCFSYKVTSLGNEYNRFGLTNTIAGVKNLSIAATYNVTSTSSNYMTAEISLDGLQSSYHLYFGVRFYGNLYVNRVWLE